MKYKMSLDKLDLLLSRLSSKEKVYLPVDNQDGQAYFEKWSEGKKLSEKLNTVKSAKDFFFPQTQNLVEFKVSGKTIDIIDNRTEFEDFIIFGVRACDVRSFDILDRVFLSDPVDSFYLARRNHSTIISFACSKPEETCFCTSFEIDPTKPNGDVRCYKTEKEIYFEDVTEKGKKLIDSISDLLTKCDDKEVEVEISKTKEILKLLPLANLKPSDFSENQLEVFKSPKWAELSKSCLGCGSCTFVCPTCQCYDIKDFNTGHGVKRFRCWDSCMYSEFTKMAAANPRLTQLEKFRQRFMHKLVYYPKNNDGIYGCVGCGRCLRKCPISMNIVKVMKSLGGEE